MKRGALFFLFTVAAAGACIGVAALASAKESTRQVQIVAGQAYRVTSPLSADPADRFVARNGLASVGAVIVSETAGTVTYELRAAHTRTLLLGRDSFDFQDPASGRSVKLVVSRVEAIP